MSDEKQDTSCQDCGEEDCCVHDCADDNHRCESCNYVYITARTCYKCHREVKPCERMLLETEDEEVKNEKKCIQHWTCDVELDGKMEWYFCKECEDWHDESDYDTRYNVCSSCSDSYYSGCIDCDKRTAHDDMIIQKNNPIGPCKSCNNKREDPNCNECRKSVSKNGFNTETHICAECQKIKDEPAACTRCYDVIHGGNKDRSHPGVCKKCIQRAEDIKQGKCVHCAEETKGKGFTGTKACRDCCNKLYRHCNGCEKNMLMTEMRHVKQEAWDVWTCAKCDITCDECSRAYVLHHGDLCVRCMNKRAGKQEQKSEMKCEICSAPTLVENLTTGTYASFEWRVCPKCNKTCHVCKKPGTVDKYGSTCKPCDTKTEHCKECNKDVRYQSEYAPIMGMCCECAKKKADAKVCICKECKKKVHDHDYDDESKLCIPCLDEKPSPMDDMGDCAWCDGVNKVFAKFASCATWMCEKCYDENGVNCTRCTEFKWEGECQLDGEELVCESCRGDAEGEDSDEGEPQHCTRCGEQINGDGKPIRPEGDNYCSSDCEEDENAETQGCSFCGREIEEGERGDNYCSDVCKRVDRPPSPPPPKQDKKSDNIVRCASCGCDVNIEFAETDDSKHYFCRECGIQDPGDLESCFRCVRTHYPKRTDPLNDEPGCDPCIEKFQGDCKTAALNISRKRTRAAEPVETKAKRARTDSFFERSKF